MSTKKSLLLSSAICSALASAAAFAQTPPAQGGGEVTEVVIVTGSYIRGTAEDAALPVDVISSEDLEKQGAPSTLELIKSLNVSAGVLGDTNQFDARAQGSEGSGSVNLRGFGPQRTLVLLNGRRLVPNPFTGAADTNFIPSAAIGRVEVLKDGAAATYGSDAIGGVVNFITKDNFEGLDLAADYKYIEDSDGDYTASVAWGWGNERSNLLIAGGYQHRSELMVKDREWAARDYLENPQGGWSAAGNPSTFVPIGVTPPSAANPLGVGAPIRDPQCAPLGGVPGLSGATPVCYWQYTVYDALTEEEDRYQAFVQYNVDISDSVALHLEGLYARTEVPIYRTSPSYAALQAPTSTTPGANNTAGTVPIPGVNGRYFVPANHPAFADFRAQNGLGAAIPGSALIVANRPFALGGNPLFGYGSSEGPREYDGFRLAAALRGEIGDSMGWDLGVTYMEQTGRRDGRDTVVNRYQLALRGLGGPDCNADAGVAGGPNCFWYNPFSNAIPSNPITGQTTSHGFNPALANENRELLEWMFPVVSTEQTSDIIVVDAVLNGETGIELGGGPLAWAFGTQYRDDSFESWYSDLNNLEVSPCVNSVKTGIIGPAGCTAAELTAPAGPLMFLGGGYNRDLSRDVWAAFGELSLPFTDAIQAQLAARYEDWGDTGTTFDPKLSMRWQIIDGLALRGSVSTTFRGPALTQTDEGSVTTLQNIGGTFRAVRTFGNPELEPEDAFTFNVGLLVRVGGLSASLDYWNFDFENPIVNEPVAGIVNAVFPTATTSNCASPLAARFAFNALGCALANITRLDIQVFNGPAVETDGFDASLEYLFDDVAGGELGIGMSATYINKYEIDATVVDGIQVANPFDAVGLLNYQTTAYPLPQWKASAFLDFSSGVHNLRWVTQYIDSYTDQRTTEFQASPNTFGIAITDGKIIDEFITHDLHYRVELPAEIVLNASVENLTDEDPSLARLDLSYDPFTASAFGRTYKLGLRKRF